MEVSGVLLIISVFIVGVIIGSLMVVESSRNLMRSWERLAKRINDEYHQALKDMNQEWKDAFGRVSQESVETVEEIEDFYRQLVSQFQEEESIKETSTEKTD